jgi:hypothetical protein
MFHLKLFVYHGDPSRFVPYREALKQWHVELIACYRTCGAEEATTFHTLHMGEEVLVGVEGISKGHSTTIMPYILGNRYGVRKYHYR